MGMVIPIPYGGVIIRPEPLRNIMIISDHDLVPDYLANKIAGGENVSVKMVGDEYKYLQISSTTPPPPPPCTPAITLNVNSDTILTPDIGTVFIDASLQPVSITLPDAVLAQGHWLALVGVDVSNGISINGPLYPNSHIEFNTNGESIILASDGLYWHVISKYMPTFYY